MDTAANCADVREDADLSDEVLDEVFGGTARAVSCECIEGRAACASAVCS